MLPTTLLPTSELSIFEAEPGSPNLLPDGALKPSATFAETLQMGLDGAIETYEVHGTGLPLCGKPLPDSEKLEVVIELPVETITIEVPADIATPLVDAVRIELPTQAAASPVSLGSAPSNDTRGPSLELALQTRNPNVAPEIARPLPQAKAGGVGIPMPVEATPRELPKDINLNRESAAPIVVPERPITQVVREFSASPTAPAVVAAGSTALEDTIAPERKANARVGGSSTSLFKMDTATEARASAPAIDKVADLKSPLSPNMPPVTQQAMPTSPVSQPAPVQADITSIQQPQFSGLQSVAAPTQPVAETTSTPPQLATTIGTPVRDAAWGDSISERVVVMANNRLQSAEIRLTPAELGPVRVQLSVDDGVTNVTFHAQHAVTREALEQAMPRLREMLAENGLTLNQSSIGEQAEQGVQQGASEDRSDTDANVAADTAVEPDDIQDGSAAPHKERSDGLVDTFA